MFCSSEKDVNATGDSSSLSNSKSPSIPVSTHTQMTTIRSLTPTPVHLTPDGCRTPSISVRSLHLKEDAETLPQINVKK